MDAQRRIEPSIEVSGVGLFSGAPCHVRLARAEGPVRVALEGATHLAEIGELEVHESERRVVVAHRGGRAELFEHLAAALGGLAVHERVDVTVRGPELPLLDGGAARYVEALRAIGARASEPRLVVARDGEVREGNSMYLFRVASEVSVEVAVDFDLAWLEPRARWNGEPDDFGRRIAPARTFVLAREIEALSDRGLAAHADPASIVVLDTDGPRAAGAPALPDEPARHKLLDLVGDLYLHGGPPRGAVMATRPGHAATHRSVRTALARGILRQCLAR